jgi:hypothetical protein
MLQRVSALHLSVRSAMAITTSVALVCAMYAAVPLESRLTALLVLVAAPAFIGTSIGYDVNGRVRGAALGALLGAALGYAVYIWLMQPVPRE